MSHNDDLLTGPHIERWRLSIEFDSLAVQAQDEPEHAFPNDAVSQLIGHLCQRWHCGPDELTEFVGWSATRVVVHTEVLDALTGVHDWLLMHTSPIRVELTREDWAGLH